jgi:hypothetical protein
MEIKVRLLYIINEYNYNCMKLNNGLIEFYKLNNNLNLDNFDFFELPIIAVKHSIIQREGEFLFENTNVKYHVHGTGISFNFNNKKFFFEYYPKTEPVRMPILGLGKIYDFIISNFPNDKLCDLNLLQENLLLLFNEKKTIKLYENYFEFYLYPQDNYGLSK